MASLEREIPIEAGNPDVSDEGSKSLELELELEHETPQRDDGKAERREAGLSPEMTERVMAKVKDINQKGTAISVLREKYLNSAEGREVIKAVLEDGLLSSKYRYKEEEKDLSVKEKWINNTRKQRRGEAHCQIVGRSINTIDENDYAYKGEVELLLDLSSYKELLPVTKETGTGRTRSFRSAARIFGERYKGILELLNLDSNASLEELRQKVIENKDEVIERYGPSGQEAVEQAEKGEKYILSSSYMGSSEYGFLIHFRVPPRNLEGIVLRPVRERTPQEIEELKRKEQAGNYNKWGENDEFLFQMRLRQNKLTEKGQEKIDAKVKQLVDLMSEAYKGKEHLMMPIYDINGNLLWPKKMSKDEIKSSAHIPDK